MSFFDLAKKHAKTTSEGEFTAVLTMLASNIHPLVLGAVNRSRNEIRFLARTLLKQHMSDTRRIDSIVNILVEERFSHNYLIGRKEARQDLHLNIIDTDSELMTDIMSLYDEYNQILHLDTPYNHETALSKDNEKTITLHRSIIESEHLTHTYSTTVRLEQSMVDERRTDIPVGSITALPIKEEWLENRDI